MIIEYACPDCGKPVAVLEVKSKNFKYKIVCFCCKFYDWVDSLEEIKPTNHDL